MVGEHVTALIDGSASGEERFSLGTKSREAQRVVY
jgi:hypothetical protein